MTTTLQTTTGDLPPPVPHLARCVMVLGTTSGAGKSWLVTALCRWYADQGFKVAPFKAQNMSNNARVVPTPDGRMGEIGSAQYFQALAARAAPDVRMNPLLLKPEADTHSQVVLMGEVNHELTHTPWRGRSEKVWPPIAAALDSLRAEYDVVVIEGAGSPAEINLYDSDIVNMRVARHANAACLLVTDIDRGGAFAHLYGTWALLPEADRALFKGFVLNKFRGDASLLAPAPQMLEQMTGIPTVATIPMLRHHGLPEEDGVFDDAPVRTEPSPSLGLGAAYLTVAVVAYPHISNLDEFQPLKNVPGVRLVWARRPVELLGADWVILPGSKSTMADLAWLRAQGLDAAVCQHAARGGAVLGICGGLQMLGEAIVDTEGVEYRPRAPEATDAAKAAKVAKAMGLAQPLSGGGAEIPAVATLAMLAEGAEGVQGATRAAIASKTALPNGNGHGHARNLSAAQAIAGNAPGLGVLPLVTSFGERKTLAKTCVRFGQLLGAWQCLSGVEVSGYEIHQGQTAVHPAMLAAGHVAHEVLPALGWQDRSGAVLGVYLHGLFEDPAVMAALFGASVPTLEHALAGLGDVVTAHMDTVALRQWVKQRVRQ